MDGRKFLDFLGKVEAMKCNVRHSWTSSGRRESVAEHSWRLALMAYLVKDEFPGLDLTKLLLMCLTHDLGEAVTGDIPAFEKTEQDSRTEQNAVSTLLSELPDPYCEELQALFTEMDAQKSAEARLYRALDRLEAVIQHNEAELETWIPLEYELQMTYGEEECSCNSYLNQLRELVREDSRRKIRKAANERI